MPGSFKARALKRSNLVFFIGFWPSFLHLSPFASWRAPLPPAAAPGSASRRREGARMSGARHRNREYGTGRDRNGLAALAAGPRPDWNRETEDAGPAPRASEGPARLFRDAASAVVRKSFRPDDRPLHPRKTPPPMAFLK